MPTPRDGESRDDFIERCIPIVIEDGTAKDGKQAFAVCNSMFDNKEVEMTEEIETIVEEVKEKPNAGKAVVASLVPMDATTFDDIEEYVKAEKVNERIGEVTRQFEALTHNIMYNPDVTDKAAAMNKIVSQFDERMKQAIDLGSTTIWDAVKSIFKKKEPPPEPKTKNGFFVWKEGDRFRWFAVYSNKFRDDDNPPEIISEKAHKRFVEMVDKGEAPFPELWHWHIPGTRWGVADWIAYDEGLGFSLASGYVDRGHEDEAKSIMDLSEPLAVSHGLAVLERNKNDDTVIDAYMSHEISELPVEAAANKLTGFSLIEAKEDEIMIPDEKKAHLLSVGLTESQIESIETDLEAKAAVANEEGLEFKEADVEEPVESPEVEGEEPVAEETEKEESIEDAEVDDLTLPASRQEVLEAIAPITEAMRGMAETIEGLSQKDETKIKQIADDTPAFSIAHLVRQDLSVIGKEKAEVDKVDGPKEKQSDEKSITGLPWLDSMLVKE